jgi:RHS repeat-associated protein
MLWRHRGAELTKWTETYTYDSQDRLAKACMTDSCSRYLAYSYDPVGNRTSLETREGTTTYSYDAADELLSKSKHCRHDVTTYAYDLNGNETRAGEKRYSYNLENELIAVSDEHGHDTVSYTYSADGLMATRATRSETTSYAWDTNSDLPQLATETDSKGQGRFQVKDSRSYTYGEAPLSIVHGRDTVTFHTDAIGSVVELSDDHGQIVDSYRYTPFGESYGPGESDEAPAETSENPMRYAGQYLDSESGLYDMRAREYDSETGRFLETDPVSCDQGGSCGSIYVYVDDRPTVQIDPSGMCPIDNATPTCMKGWKNPTQEGTVKSSPFDRKINEHIAPMYLSWVEQAETICARSALTTCGIGYGHTAVSGGWIISITTGARIIKIFNYANADAVPLLITDLNDMARSVLQNRSGTNSLDKNQFSAVLDLAYNGGLGSVGNGTEKIVHDANHHEQVTFIEAFDAFKNPTDCKGVLGRRLGEAAIFVQKTGAYTTTPYEWGQKYPNLIAGARSC